MESLLIVFGIFAALGVATWLRPWPLFPVADPVPPSQQQNVSVAFAAWVERQAKARGLNVRGVARPIPVECPKCRKASNYFVYPDELCERCWRARLNAGSTPASENRA